MAIFSQGPNPANRQPTWGSVLSPLAEAAGSYGRQHREEQQNIAQNTELANVLGKLGPEASFYDVMKHLSESKLQPKRQQQFVENYLRNQESQVKQKQAEAAQAKPNAQAQKWAYSQLDKQSGIDQLQSAINRLRQINQERVTGPVVGNIPESIRGVFANAQEEAMRREIPVAGLQLLNVHKAMFPRGLTDREFKNLSEKIVNPSNTPEVNDAILNNYEALAQVQQAKIDKLKEAISEHGFSPELPLLMGNIDKEFEEIGNQVSRSLYDDVMFKNSSPPKFPNMGKGKGESGGLPGAPEELGRTQQVKVRHKKSGKTVEIPREEFHPHPDYELLDTGNQ